MWPDQQWLLVEGQMTTGLSVGVLAEKVAAVVEVRHVAVVSRVGADGLMLHEPAVGEGHHWGVLQGVIRSKVTW